ncbi:Calx-beta domain-containing protein [Solirubrobacter soli]|uniref:Calx-beta domain-containing protein n=1 Tax=Solirubrobacter soli TaxID=363832 RepID=UPI00040D56AD|nr:Calx-beta domain-containing protein [Solirubrobacter soli]
MTGKVCWLIAAFALALPASPALAAPSISAPPDVVVGESDGFVDLPVRLSAASADTVTVNFATAQSTAGPGTFCNFDYVHTTGTLTFVPGDISETVHVQLGDCPLVESLESFTVNLSTAVNGVIARASTRVSIVDNDTVVATPRLYVRDAVVDESDGVALVPVLLGGPSGQASNSTVTVGYTAPGLPPGTLTFAPGQTVKTIAVPITDDATPEKRETLSVTLSNPTNATIVNGTGTITVGPSDTVPSTQPSVLAPPDAIVGEADGYVDVPVRLSTPGTEPVTVAYATAQSTAGPGTFCNFDYVHIAGTLTFAPGETTKALRIDLGDCGSAEALESFTLGLSTAVNAVITRASARISIVDADTIVATPKLYVRDVVVDESDGVAFVPVLLGGPSGQVSNSVVTVGYSAPGLPAGTLTFAPGQTVRTIAVPIADDATPETHETLGVTLSNPTNATIVNGTGTITVGPSDTGPSTLPSLLAPPDAIVGEADGYVDVPVRLSTPGTEPITVAYATAQSTAGPGTFCNFDYVHIAGTLTFAPGETTKPLRIDLGDCGTAENLESFTLELSTAVNAVITRASARISIVDADTIVATPKLYVRDVVVDEKDTVALVPVLLGGPLGQTSNSVVTVDYTAPGQTGTLTFAPGQTVKTIAVPIIDDATPEGPETLAVTLANPVNATLADAAGTVTIGASDGAPSTQPSIAAQSDVLVSEGDGYVDLAIRLSTPGTEPVKVAYATTQSTAGPGTFCNFDYVHIAGTLTFAPGETTKVLRVQLGDCPAVEGLESFTLDLSAAVNGVITRPRVRISILDGTTTLSSVAVTPSNPSTAAGTDRQFTATGTFSNASTLDVTGFVAWASSTPAVATVGEGGLAHGVSSGTSTISATLGTVTGSTVLTVTAPQPAAQTITFGTLGGRTFGTPDFTVAATASSGLPVAFTAAGTCTVAGTTVHLTGAGTCTITASQAGDATHLAAADVSRAFAIAKAAQSIAFPAIADRTLSSGDFDVSATASSGLAVAFSASGPCSVSGTRVQLTGAGTCTLRATQDGGADYEAAAPVSRAFTISAPTPIPIRRCTVPNVTGKTLAAAKSALTRAHCRTGSVSRAFSRKVKKGRVISQSRKAGKVLAADAKVNLVISRGRR